MTEKDTNNKNGPTAKPSTPTQSFGSLLKQYRYDYAMTQADLAKYLAVSQSRISSWEAGRAGSPSESTVLMIGKALNLTPTETNRLLSVAGYRQLDSFTDESMVQDTNESTAVSGTRDVLVRRPSTEVMQEFSVQIQDLRDLVETLGQKIDGGKTPSEDLSLVRDEILDIREVVADLQVTSQEITAPVIIPSPKQMEVKLIPITSFKALEEYRSDENKWYSWTAMFIGAILGTIINLATGGQATTATLLILGTFVAMTVFSFWQARIFTNRANALKQELIENSQS